jgi:hypothetical protein
VQIDLKCFRNPLVLSKKGLPKATTHGFPKAAGNKMTKIGPTPEY